MLTLFFSLSFADFDSTKNTKSNGSGPPKQSKPTWMETTLAKHRALYQEAYFKNMNGRKIYLRELPKRSSIKPTQRWNGAHPWDLVDLNGVHRYAHGVVSEEGRFYVAYTQSKKRGGLATLFYPYQQQAMLRQDELSIKFPQKSKPKLNYPEFALS